MGFLDCTKAYVLPLFPTLFSTLFPHTPSRKIQHETTFTKKKKSSANSHYPHRSPPPNSAKQPTP